MPAFDTSTSTRPHALDHGATPALTCVLVGHVHGDADGLAGPLAVSFRRGLLGGVEPEVGNRHLRAFGDVAFGDALADAAGGAGDDADLVLQVHFASFLLGAATQRPHLAPGSCHELK